MEETREQLIKANEYSISVWPIQSSLLKVLISFKIYTYIS